MKIIELDVKEFLLTVEDIFDHEPYLATHIKRTGIVNEFTISLDGDINRNELIYTIRLSLMKFVMIVSDNVYEALTNDISIKSNTEFEKNKAYIFRIDENGKEVESVSLLIVDRVLDQDDFEKEFSYEYFTFKDEEILYFIH